MDESYDPHMLDVTRLAAVSWSYVLQQTAAQRLVKVDLFPVGVKADLLDKVGKNDSRSTKDLFYELVHLLKPSAYDKQSRLFCVTTDLVNPTEEDIRNFGCYRK